MINYIKLADLYDVPADEIKDEFLEIINLGTYGTFKDDEGKFTISYSGDAIEKFPSLETILELKQSKENIEKEKRINILTNNICNKLYNEGQTFISGKVMSAEQIDRYKRKYNLALAGDISSFIEEATIVGKDVEVLIKEVITNYETWLSKSDSLSNKVESFRQYIKKLMLEDNQDLLNYVVKYVSVNNEIIIDNTDIIKLIKSIEADFLNK